jgi:hypothetical protein
MLIHMIAVEGAVVRCRCHLAIELLSLARLEGWDYLLFHRYRKLPGLRRSEFPEPIRQVIEPLAVEKAK